MNPSSIPAATPRHRFWREVTSGELFASALHLSPERIRQASESANDVGHALKDVWRNLEDKVRAALDLPAVEHHVSPAQREHIADIASAVGYGVGLAGAGILGASGVVKILGAVKKRETGRLLDGLVDLSAGIAVAGGVMAWGPAGLVLGPAAAVVGMVRGGYNAYDGYRDGASRREVQGFLDGANSSLAFSRLLSKEMGAFGTAAMVLAPVAGAVQLARGFGDLSRGLREGSNEKKVQGLADICAAVGLAASAFGPLAVAGVALVGVGTAVKVLYQFSPRARARIDRRVDKMTPRLARMVGRVDRVVDPTLVRVRKIIEKVTGVKRGDEDSKPAETAAAGPVVPPAGAGLPNGGSGTSTRPALVGGV